MKKTKMKKLLQIVKQIIETIIEIIEKEEK